MKITLNGGNQMKDNRPPKEERTLKRGDARNDGKLFWAYAPNSTGGEDWLSPDAFALRAAKKKPDCRPEPQLRTLKSGDVREDGKVFLSYHASSKDGERWITEAKLNEERIRCAENAKRSYLKNPPKAKARNLKYHKDRRAKCPEFKMRTNLRTRLCQAIRLGKGMKHGKTRELLGCTWAEAREHLERQFSEGMTWDNYGRDGWHIDHIKPCAKFNLMLDSEQRECFHYTNLQPLWAEDNLTKGDKYEDNK